MNQTTMNQQSQTPIPPPVYTQAHPPHYQNQPHLYQHQYPQQPNPTNTNSIPPSINPHPPQSYVSNPQIAVSYTTQPTHYVPSYDVGTNAVTCATQPTHYVPSYDVGTNAVTCATQPTHYVPSYDVGTNAVTCATQPTHYVPSYDVGTNAVTSYYHDPNWVPSYQAFGVAPPPYFAPNNNIVPPTGVQQHVTPKYDLSRVTKPAVLHRLYKKQSKIPNVSLSVRCEVCNILCDTHDVLEKHRLGKKHKKNLEKLKASVAGGPAGVVNPDTSKAGNGQTSKKKAASTPEELEAKRRRVLGGGTSLHSLKMCSVCNVVCNSDTVYQAHLAGKMHQSMLKKQARAKLPASSAAKSS